MPFCPHPQCSCCSTSWLGNITPLSLLSHHTITLLCTKLFKHLVGLIFSLLFSEREPCESASAWRTKTTWKSKTGMLWCFRDEEVYFPGSFCELESTFWDTILRTWIWKKCASFSDASKLFFLFFCFLFFLLCIPSLKLTFLCLCCLNFWHCYCYYWNALAF